MTCITSASTQNCYPVAAVCRVWKSPRATLYRHRAAEAMPAPPARRRGPQGACSDAELLAKIEAVTVQRGRLSQSLGPTAGRRRLHGGAQGAADHAGEQPARAATAGGQGGTSA